MRWHAERGGQQPSSYMSGYMGNKVVHWWPWKWMIIWAWIMGILLCVNVIMWVSVRGGH